MIDRAWQPTGAGRPGPGRAGDGADRATIFMVSLFLILLAFFILLNVISEFEERRSREVLNSLSETFSPGPSWIPGDFGLGGDALGYDRAAKMQQDVAALFETEIAMARVTTVKRGRLMEVVLPVGVLFETDGATLRSGMRPLVERLAMLLTETPPALRYDLEFFAHGTGLPPTQGGRAPVEILRAGAFADALMRWNAPPDAVSAGVQRGDPREVVLRFHTRRRDRDRISFDPVSGG